jgi:hypothetical protein
MDRRWWDRLFRRKGRIHEAARRGFEQFAREMDGTPPAAHTDGSEVEADPDSAAEPRRTPSFA